MMRHSWSKSRTNQFTTDNDISNASSSASLHSNSTATAIAASTSTSTSSSTTTSRTNSTTLAASCTYTDDDDPEHPDKCIFSPQHHLPPFGSHTPLVASLFSSKRLSCVFILASLIAVLHYYRNPPPTPVSGASRLSDTARVYFIIRPPTNPDAFFVRRMTMHAWDGYITHARMQNKTSNGFVYHDNLDPISCKGVDELGDISVTLIDAADTLATNGLLSRFRAAVDTISLINDFKFNRYVSFFEICIRILGGLISAHNFAVDALGASYDGKLLKLAIDIGDRLYMSFYSPSGIPFARINLATGERSNSWISIAEVGSNLLEFGYLSKLSGDPKYYIAAKRALIQAFRQRSKIGLYGQNVDAGSGRFTSDSSHISGGIDSFFEYLIKAYFVFHDDDLYVIFMEAYRAVERHLESAGVHLTVSRTTGAFQVSQVDALELFWPGLQVLIGDFDPAIRKLRVAGQILTRHNFIPEASSASDLAVINAWGGQRPELAESIYYMSTAFNDPGLLLFSKRIRDKTEQITKTKCGYAAMHNVDYANKKALEHRQMSFLVAELFKYLYLTADKPNRVNGISDGSAYIMTTEAHPYKILVHTRRQKFKTHIDLASELGISDSELELKYGMKTRICSYPVWLRASLFLSFAPVKTGFPWMQGNFPIKVTA